MASALTTVTLSAPSRRQFSSSSRARPGWSSTATTSPSSCVALPPGAAQRSSVRSPGCEPTARPASCEPRLCGQIRPAASASSSTRSTCSASGRSGSGRPSTCPVLRRLRRTTRSGGSFCARISARACSGPSVSHQSSATQSGYECLSAAAAGVSSGKASSNGVMPSESLRITAFVNGTARSSRAERTSSTVSLTAACGGTSVKPSWYAPSRNAARTGGSSLRAGRRPSLSIAWSSVRMRWTVPNASRCASARSRPSSCFATLRKTRSAYASSSNTRNTTS